MFMKDKELCNRFAIKYALKYFYITWMFSVIFDKKKLPVATY